VRWKRWFPKIQPLVVTQCRERCKHLKLLPQQTMHISKEIELPRVCSSKGYAGSDQTLKAKFKQRPHPWTKHFNFKIKLFWDTKALNSSGMCVATF